MTTTILHGDCRFLLSTLETASVQCVITSPPYFGLRSYLPDGHQDKEHEIGLEPTPAVYVAALVGVFREVWRVLCDDGTLWLNLGDCYAGSWGNYGTRDGKQRGDRSSDTWVRPSYDGDEGYKAKPPTASVPGIRNKSLIGIPWRVAFALQDEGWILRSDIIWSKPNAMPESVTDRPTKAHEYLFLFVKQERYYYNADAIVEPAQEWDGQAGTFKRTDSKRGMALVPGQQYGTHRTNRKDTIQTGTRNKRTVWAIPTYSYSDAHFAVMPEALVEPCILAGSRPGDTVLDPFAGSGTTLRVAEKHRRNGIGMELNEAYTKLCERRTDGVQVTLPLEDAA